MIAVPPILMVQWRLSPKPKIIVSCVCASGSSFTKKPALGGSWKHEFLEWNHWRFQFRDKWSNTWWASTPSRYFFWLLTSGQHFWGVKKERNCHRIYSTINQTTNSSYLGQCLWYWTHLNLHITSPFGCNLVASWFSQRKPHHLFRWWVFLQINDLMIHRLHRFEQQVEHPWSWGWKLEVGSQPPFERCWPHFSCLDKLPFRVFRFPLFWS